MIGRIEGAHHFCIEHGCNQNICSGKPSASVYDDNERGGGGVSVKAKEDEGEEHDLDLDNFMLIHGEAVVSLLRGSGVTIKSIATGQLWHLHRHPTFFEPNANNDA